MGYKSEMFLSVETTSDILVSLAQTEEKKNHAIIYPVCLSEEKKQVCFFFKSFLRSHIWSVLVHSIVCKF